MAFCEIRRPVLACAQPAVRQIESVCVHEHVENPVWICEGCLSEPMLACWWCWNLPDADRHMCAVSMRVIEPDADNASGAPVALARQTPHPAGPRRPSSLYGDDAKDGTHG